MENIAIFRKFFLFANLTGIELVQVNRIIVRHAYPKGTLIIDEGSVGDSLFIVKSGRVKISKKDKRGRISTLAILGKGDHIGEISLFDRGPRSASVVAEDNCELLEISGDSLSKLMAQTPSLAVKLYKNFVVSLCQRLRSTNILLSNK